MRFRVLGPLEIDSADGLVIVSGQRLRALLTAQLLQPNTVVSIDRLVDALSGSLEIRTVSRTSPNSVIRTNTDRRRCRSIPTNCRPSYDSLTGASSNR